MGEKKEDSVVGITVSTSDVSRAFYTAVRRFLMLIMIKSFSKHASKRWVTNINTDRRRGLRRAWRSLQSLGGAGVASASSTVRT